MLDMQASIDRAIVVQEMSVKFPHLMHQQMPERKSEMSHLHGNYGQAPIYPATSTLISLTN